MKSIFALSALALAACGAQPESESRERANTSESLVSSRPPSTARTEAPSAGIPVALHGRWALVPDDCTSTRGDAKGLLTIDATTLKFYESRAVIGTIAESTPTRLLADFAFSGEGMTWNRRLLLDAQQGGNALIRREYGEDAAPRPFRYLRCPGRNG